MRHFKVRINFRDARSSQGGDGEIASDGFGAQVLAVVLAASLECIIEEEISHIHVLGVLG